MQANSIYAGEDFGLYGTLKFSGEDTGSSIGEFDMEIILGTTPSGATLRCSTTDPGGVAIHYRDENKFVVNVPAVYSEKLSSGKLVMTVTLTHRETGAVIIGERECVDIVEPLNK